MDLLVAHCTTQFHEAATLTAHGPSSTVSLTAQIMKINRSTIGAAEPKRRQEGSTRRKPRSEPIPSLSLVGEVPSATLPTPATATSVPLTAVILPTVFSLAFLVALGFVILHRNIRKRSCALLRSLCHKCRAVCVRRLIGSKEEAKCPSAAAKDLVECRRPAVRRDDIELSVRSPRSTADRDSHRSGLDRGETRAWSTDAIRKPFISLVQNPQATRTHRNFILVESYASLRTSTTSEDGKARPERPSLSIPLQKLWPSNARPTSGGSRSKTASVVVFSPLWEDPSECSHTGCATSDASSSVTSWEGRDKDSPDLGEGSIAIASSPTPSLYTQIESPHENQESPTTFTRTPSSYSQSPSSELDMSFVNGPGGAADFAFPSLILQNSSSGSLHSSAMGSPIAAHWEELALSSAPVHRQASYLVFPSVATSSVFSVPLPPVSSTSDSEVTSEVE